jgi:hypothetical protein
MTEWSLKDAKEHFAEIFSAAQTSPQVVTDGAVAVVVRREDDVRPAKTPQGEKKVLYKGKMMGLAELLMAMPYKEGFEIERVDIVPRDVEF